MWVSEFKSKQIPRSQIISLKTQLRLGDSNMGWNYLQVLKGKNYLGQK